MKSLVVTSAALAAFAAGPSGILRAQAPAVVPEMPGEEAQGGSPAATPSPGAGGGDSEDTLCAINMDNVDIKYVIKLVSDLTGRNYLLTEQVRGNVTIMSPTQIPVEQLPKILESLLEVRGFAAVPVGDIIKIVPRQEAAKSPIQLETEAGIRERIPDEAFVTQIIPLQYASLDEVKNLAQTLSGKNANVIAYPPANSLIVSDAASNLGRLMKIIKEVDIPGLESTITVVPLQYAAATIMAEEVLSIISQKGAAAARGAPGRRPARRPAQPAAAPAGGEDSIKIFADERTNALIVVASPEDTERVLALVEELDRPTPESKTRVRVKRLSYSNSDDVANVLTSLTASRTGEGMPPVTVTSYPEINAIVIDASPQDYDLLQRIIEDLDIPRDQVMVEVIFTEVNLARSLSAEFQTQTLKSIKWSTNDPQQMGWDNTQNWGGTEFDPSLRTLIINDLEKQYPISAGSGLNFGFVETPDSDKNFIGPFGVLLNALEADTDINVLAAPQVLTCDNEEVQLKVVDNIPVVSSTLTVGAGTTGTDTIQQIDYRDVGTEITLTPHISKDRFVRLEVHQKSDQLVGVTLADIKGPLTPATLKRETQTVINVKDGHTVVISGMIADGYATQESKVPILGDIPIAGLLARYRKNAVQKLNLMIFITPRIVRNPTELAQVTQKTRDRGDVFLEESHGEPVRLLERFFQQVKDEPVKKMPAAGEAERPYGIKNAPAN